jgi:glycolate oxidase
LNWADVQRIKEKFDIPLLIKGIHRADDAVRAVECGVDVVYVSNHGGRQLDQAPGTLDLLPDIVREIKGKAEIAIDGGFYRGTDIVKAMAMGADAVGIGRLEAWSLAAGGAPALLRCLHILHAEIREALVLCGVTSFAELDDSFVSPAQPVVEPHVLSAFPLVDITDPGY